MTTDYTDDYLVGLVRELCKLSYETECTEFKENKAEPQEIGAYISALANSAALEGKPSAYVVWGIHNENHTVIGTTFNPQEARISNEQLESWLLRLLEPKIDFHFYTVAVDDKPIVLLKIERAVRHPVRFSGTEYIRVGSYTKKLRDASEKERALWRAFERVPFEKGVTSERLSDEEVLASLDYQAYFNLLKAPAPEHRSGILSALANDALISPCEAGGWDITNMGAILLANRLSDFPNLQRKAMRVIQYRGADRTETLKEREYARGYASSFEKMVAYINGLLPSNEVIGQALREVVPMFPGLAIRELVANALIHQDFFITGTGPMVEIFNDRIEITNPGEPLMDTQRFMDMPPKSRNEMLASLLRRFRICEERGSGIEKVALQVELYQLPAPLFEVPTGSTRVVLFASRPLTKMKQDERVRACYFHACLQYVTRRPVNNTSIRKRFGLPENNAAQASRLIKEALEAKAIVIQDPSIGVRGRTYLPFWAR